MTSDPGEEQLRQEYAAKSIFSWRWTLIALGILVALGVVFAIVQATRPDERSTDDVADQIEAWAEEKGARSAEADCPDPVEWRVGETFRCILTVDDQDVRVTVTMENDQGEVTWITG